MEFRSEEIQTLSKGFGASLEMFEIMHDALLDRARTPAAERGESDSHTVAAAN